MSDTDYLDDSFIEQIWHDLGGQVPRERIHQIAAEAAAEFRTATVTAFVPVFVRRRTREKLEVLINERDYQ
jgi:hypothetical protein